MPARVSYEPSVRSLVAHVFPAGTEVYGDTVGLSKRISWPVVLRATGLGRVEGGELVLVPAGREAAVLGRLDELAALGVAAVAVSELAGTPDAAPAVPLVVAPVPDPRRLREEIERYIGRRRRELFTLDGEMHRLLVDAAIAGAPLRRLVDSAYEKTGRPILVDRDGELTIAGTAFPEQVGRGLWGPAALARPADAGPSYSNDGVTMPIAVGDAFYGFATIAASQPTTADDDEVILSALSAAAAITLARSPAPAIPDLDAYLAEHLTEHSGAPLVALALSHPTLPATTLARALASELTARGMDPAVALDGRTAVYVMPAPPDMAQSLVDALALRIRADDLRAGLGRPGLGAAGVRRSVVQATDAIRLGQGRLVPFEAVELDALLSTVTNPEAFVQARLGALPDRPELLDTLEVFLDTGRRVGETAARLHVHRNTVIYRVGRIEDELRLDLSGGENAFSLQLALRLRRVARGEDQRKRT